VSSILGIAAFTTGIVLGVFFLGMFPAGSASAPYALAGSLLTSAAGLAASYVWARERPA
jgi:hypothetical protein